MPVLFIAAPKKQLTPMSCHGENTAHRRLTLDSRMLVRKSDLLAHDDIGHDRPFEDQDHVTMT